MCWGIAPVHLSGYLLSIIYPIHTNLFHLLPPLELLNTITHHMTNDRLSLPRYQKAPAIFKCRDIGTPVLPALIGGRAVPLAVLLSSFPLSPPPLLLVPSSGGLVRGDTWRASAAWFISLAPLPSHSGSPKEPTRLQRASARKPGISWNKPFCRPVKNVLWLAN